MKNEANENVMNEDASIASNSLKEVFEYLDSKTNILVHRLRDFVSFPTVLSDHSKSDSLGEMQKFVVETLNKFGMKTSVTNIDTEGMLKEPGKSYILILAETDQKIFKPTVCFYCHIDVLPETFKDHWYGNPFVLTYNNDETEIFGKGASVSKGPLLGVINAIAAYWTLGLELPVNVKLVIDPLGTSEIDYTGKFLKDTSLKFFEDVNFLCMCVGAWLGDEKPCVVHGCRGICYFSIEIEGPNKDLHSGFYGGVLNEPISDLVYMLDSLVDNKGVILVPGLYDDVVKITKKEKELLKTVKFNVLKFKNKIGAFELLGKENPTNLLNNLWYMPSLSIHGIEGGSSGRGSQNVIPSKVNGKFSINLVPKMVPSQVKEKVVEYLSKVWKVRKSSNKIRIQMSIGKSGWLTELDNENCIAAQNAITRVFNVEPDFIRSSQRVRSANCLRKLANAPLVIIPISRAIDVSEEEPERISVRNYVNGSKMFAAYMQELAANWRNVVVPESEECPCKITNEPDECVCERNSKFSEETGMDSEKNLSTPSIGSDGFSNGHSLEENSYSRYYKYCSKIKTKIEALNELMTKGNVLNTNKYEKVDHATNSGSQAKGKESLNDSTALEISLRSEAKTLQNFERETSNNDETTVLTENVLKIRQKLPCLESKNRSVENDSSCNTVPDQLKKNCTYHYAKDESKCFDVEIIDRENVLQSTLFWLGPNPEDKCLQSFRIELPFRGETLFLPATSIVNHSKIMRKTGKVSNFKPKIRKKANSDMCGYLVPVDVVKQKLSTQKKNLGSNSIKLGISGIQDENHSKRDVQPDEDNIDILNARSMVNLSSELKINSLKTGYESVEK